MQRRVMDRITLINKLNSLPYKEISQTVVDFWFKTIGYEIDPNPEESDEECNTN